MSTAGSTSSSAARSKPLAAPTTRPAAASPPAPALPEDAVESPRAAMRAAHSTDRLPPAAPGAPPQVLSNAPWSPESPQAASGIPCLSRGSATDHPLVQHFLMTLQQTASPDAFLASLDDPFYEPHDRLLIKSGARILSHLQLLSRTMEFGTRRFPVTLAAHLATLPEFRGQGLAQRLLAEAEHVMRQEGTVLGWLSTRIPHFFRPAGWALCGRHCVSRGGARELLARISESMVDDLLHPLQPLTIRPWRQVELPSVMRLYGQQYQGTYGAFERTEPYWRWLISRKSYDQIFVAIDGPDRFELDDGSAPIVGYCVMREDEIVELAADPRQPRVATQLLARACSEAIERDHHSVALYAPPSCSLHALFREAGGCHLHHEAHQGEVFMVRLFDPPSLLRSMSDEWHRRADAARLPRPTDLGLLVDGQKFRLAFTRRGVKVLDDRIGRSYLSCNQAEFARLLLGHTDLEEAVSQGRIESSTRVAIELGQAIFARVPFWRPPLDQLGA